MDEEQLDIDIKTKIIKKAEIFDDIDNANLIDDDIDDFSDVDSEIDYNFLPNVKDEQKSQDEIFNDYLVENKKGILVYDIEWFEGFFLKT